MKKTLIKKECQLQQFFFVKKNQSNNKEHIDKLEGLLVPSLPPRKSFEVQKEVEKELTLQFVTVGSVILGGSAVPSTGIRDWPSR